MQKIICFGEILWDMLPQGKMPGGAPMNVAFHLHRLGLNASPLTALGKDDLGYELADFLRSKLIPTDLMKNKKPATIYKLRQPGILLKSKKSFYPTLPH